MVTHVKMSMSAKINRVTISVGTRQEGTLFCKLLVGAVNGLSMVLKIMRIRFRLYN